MNAKTKTTTATTSKGSGNVKTQIITRKKRVRLFFYGGAKKDEDNNTFLNAAQNVKRDYDRDKVDNIKIRPFYEMEDAESIVEKINSEEDGSIESIDFFSHGGVPGLYVKNTYLFHHNQSLYMNEEAEDENDGWFGFGSAANLSDINYSKFTNTAIIEIHGCKTASVEEKYKGVNFAMIFSQHLYNAGKNKSVVIGHITKANPNINPNSKVSDYRHGKRRVYHNGEELFITTIKGRISSSIINNELKKKQRN